MHNVGSISIKAILSGLLVGYLGSIIGGIAMGVPLVIYGAIRGISVDAMIDSIGISIITMAIGLIFTMFGGYVAARIAKFDEIKHGLIVGIISSGIGVTFILFTGDTLLDWYNLTSTILIIPFSLFGGYIRLTLKKDNNR